MVRGFSVMILSYGTFHWFFPCDFHGEDGNMLLKLTKNLRENDDAYALGFRP